MIARIAIGAVLALFAVAYGVALQNLHTAGWTNPAVAAIGTLRRSERRSQSIAAKAQLNTASNETPPDGRAVLLPGSAVARIAAIA